MLVTFTAPERKLQIVTDGLPLGIAPKMYIGLGYNPDLATMGERLDMLDLFYWMQIVTPPQNWMIWDASSYFVVNRIPEKLLRSLGVKSCPAQILDMIVSELYLPKRKELLDNIVARQSFLRQFAKLYGLNQQVIWDAATVMVTDKSFGYALGAALDTVNRLSVEQPDLLANIYPRNANAVSKLYLPLEMAEALYLLGQGIGTKIGPETEVFFDAAILALMQDAQRAPYTTVRFPAGPRRTPYVSDRNVLWTTSPDTWVEDLLGSDTEYKAYVERYTSPFRKAESLENCVKTLRDILAGGAP